MTECLYVGGTCNLLSKEGWFWQEKKEIVTIIARPPGSMWPVPGKLFLGTQTQRSYAIIVPDNERFEGEERGIL